MKCEQVVPYLPGFAGGDLRPDTARVVEEHVAGCSSCRADVAQLARVRTALATLTEREIEPPPFLVDAIIEQTETRAPRRVLAPILPVSVDEVARLVSDHRDTIASTAGVALVAAGAAYALWRAVRGSKTAQPATS
jgi:anti-sigma factor RsiW